MSNPVRPFARCVYLRPPARRDPQRLRRRLGPVAQLGPGGSGGRLVSVQVGAGRVLWRHAGWRCRLPITGPTPLGDGGIFLTGGHRARTAPGPDLGCAGMAGVGRCPL